MRKLLALVAFAFAAACTPSPTPAPADPAPVPAVEAPKPENATDEATCKTGGGEWKPICRMQKPACVTTYADAGKACTDGSECAGDCVSAGGGEFPAAGATATGVCSTNNDPCGCKQTITGGKANAAICVD